MSRAASEPSSKLPAGGELIDVGRQRLDIERAQQQRRRQFLQAIDEHQQRRAPQRRAQQRQMDRPDQRRTGACRACARRRRVRSRCARGRPARSRSRWRGSAPRRRQITAALEPASTRPTCDAGEAPRDGVDRLVDGDQRRQQAERQHRAGHRIAEAGDEEAGRGERPAHAAAARRPRQSRARAISTVAQPASSTVVKVWRTRARIEADQQPAGDHLVGEMTTAE